MRRIIESRPSPAIIIAVVALVAAVAGTAIAGPSATTSAVTKSKVKKIANKQIDKRLPLSGAEIEDGSLDDQDLGRVVTGSFNMGSLTAGTCANGDFLNFPDADDQDLILVTPTGTGIPETNFDVPGELIMLGIPHSGEGHLKVCNVSGGSIDPDTVTYRAVLIEG
jgi:hypothetical protein